ncbi:MAG: hypothetical protein FWE41_05595 [Coriobacteriia bacterium]|nr:hypothetical protein [Coriobacteriia bacterium]MCL2749433.1 hypothetical protein [Coriobacteriia bacterium]
MEIARKKIISVCNILIASSLLTGCILIASGIWDVIWVTALESNQGEYSNMITSWTWLTVPFLQAAALGYLAFIFYSIKKEQSPFTRKSVLHMKIFALVLFLVLALPHLLLELMLVLIRLSGIPAIMTGFVVSPTITSVVFALIAATIMYCLALIFQNGAKLQANTDEIV